MTNTGMFAPIKKSIEKLSNMIVFSSEFTSAIVQFNIIQIVEDEDEAGLALAGEGDIIDNALSRRAVTVTVAALEKQLSKIFLFFSSFSVTRLLAAITFNGSSFIKSARRIQISTGNPLAPLLAALI